ncbi:MAG: response regulator, partial [Desulfobulbia bacterium]
MTDSDTFSITVAEDAEINVEILLDILGNDYDVRVTKDGEEALGSIKNDPPDLVLLDIVMPKMDGIAVCRQLKKIDRTKDIPIIFLTSKTDNASILDGFT